MNNPEELLTAPQAARIMNCTIPAVTRSALPRIKIGTDRKVRYRRADVEKAAETGAYSRLPKHNQRALDRILAANPTVQKARCLPAVRRLMNAIILYESGQHTLALFEATKAEAEARAFISKGIF
jgi:hypothetical protein